MRTQLVICSGALALFATALAPLEARASDDCTPAKLMVVLDKSSSMQTGTIGAQTKWQIAAGALDTVASAYEDAIELGLNVFPQPSECSPGTVLVAPGLGNRDAIMDQLVEAPPTSGNWTPMAQTLEAVAVDATMQDLGAPRYAVLITDGWQWCSPYDPATRFAPVDAIGSLNAAGITTYVVGFGASVDALTLNLMAVEAGTARPGCDPSGDVPGLPDACYHSAGDPDELLDALTDIAFTVSSEICDGEDNDCDGEVDEDLYRPCATDCGLGIETCVDGEWVDCDAPPVEEEICDGEDNDCDGVTDPGCSCVPGESHFCGPTLTTGECQPGTQLCLANGTWSGCQGAVYPQPEICDGLDNDCDGRIDEFDDDVGNLCGPGFECVDGECVPLVSVNPPEEDPAPAADGDPAGGCGCAGSVAREPHSAAGAFLLALLCAVGLRRRRPQDRPRK